MGRAVIIAAAALASGSGLFGAFQSANAVTHGRPLPAKTSTDVTRLVHQEEALTATLKAFPGTKASTARTRWEAIYRARLAAQSTAAAAVTKDLTRTSAPSSGSILQNVSGSGGSSLAKFTVPGTTNGWRMAWTYNCTSFGYKGNFLVYITGYGAASGTPDSGPNQLGISGSGVEHYYDTGTFSLKVISECSWTVEVLARG